MSRAATFRELHTAAAPLRLLNAWDAGSAKVLVAAGAPSLGTTSAGIAFALGLPDGERLGRDAMLRAVAAIAVAAGDAFTRARAYAKARADGVFVPGAREPELLRALVAAVEGFETTINVLAVPGLPPVSSLSALGIARVSTGSGPARAALSVTQLAARELLDDGTYGAATGGALSYAEVNTIMGG
ncbi:hypothetical protein DSM104299_04684 [Baekduia alba]|uniref:isocitrate lyase/phosphoenolpyruvate mutase family protein n=1 Tax=Baekduia alba TaxID=2997333 RepID=UPI00233FB20B|nr:isocitrate lyase/phosphoenolpyruvate mutase family protein [Baekduia alba]WCB95932.1 hypothetical protein DSM104299_04684 [Baekduia alba]